MTCVTAVVDQVIAAVANIRTARGDMGLRRRLVNGLHCLNISLA
jgi:hypothetical protein